MKLEEFMINAKDKLDPALYEMFESCFMKTINTTLKPHCGGFVITGDIPAMWLRDSSAQVQHYLPFVNDEPNLKEFIKDVIARQMLFINHDPYANAFRDQFALDKGYVFERKFELDSLCYPLSLAHSYHKLTNDDSIFTDSFRSAVSRILSVFEAQQYHNSCSQYKYTNNDAFLAGVYTETLMNDGKGTPVNYTGMIWSGFRPSDDACTFGYNIPQNMFAIVVLGHIVDWAEQSLFDRTLCMTARQLQKQIEYGIATYGTVVHPKYGKMYAYETDGYGNHLLMDDANIPSLLSAPYLGFCEPTDPIYLGTRAFVLSKDNPYYYTGIFSGVGSPHTPIDHIWHLGSIMQAITETSQEESIRLINLIAVSTAGTNNMHESFHKDNPGNFTRSWFAWADSLFAELILTHLYEMG